MWRRWPLHHAARATWPENRVTIWVCEKNASNPFLSKVMYKLYHGTSSPKILEKIAQSGHPDWKHFF
jgi:hypothetical protein